ncbi:MAG: T9SS type A sorting domain-containing protein, partial [candidate division WOR-3 bacterium]
MIIFFIFFAWYRFPIDTAMGEGTSIAIDQSHRPHLFYYQSSRLFHSYWDGSRWHKDFIDSAASYHNGGPGVVIDNQGRFHIAFFNRRERLSYGYYDQGWKIETVDTAFRTGDYCDIALDRNQRPGIAYHRSTGTFSGYLRYAVKTGSAWQIYEHSSEYGGYNASLELDSLDHPHISDCTSWSTGDLRYIYYDSQGWHYIKPTGTTTYTESYSSIALDAQDRPQISFYWAGGGGDNFDLRFTEKNTCTWRVHPVDHGIRLDKRGWENRIVIDGGGLLHIVYHCHNSNLLKYARGQEGNWTTQIVDTIGGYSANTSIALDGSDVFLGYCDEISTDVWIASTRNFVEIAETKNKATRPSGFKIINGPFRATGPLQIYDITGQMILAHNLKSEQLVKIDHPGIYFLKTKNVTYKII